uniref:Molybdate transport system substrate-binding protein n=1 Tax=Candidatus Kentrum sp. TUN TaxID=2126343 RepID=A0A451A9A3_9GAMM|nr:MAG: molybdate transport system substrate-binding protein [Candidatus Kentron sp. TUN]VFK56350.1 MAG: molybdate transport system substrate-binding protein [Candidatus Kentron sp. TUN]VFK62612.1 MAG: molybdate transport system substrate-binding protein [Candidatus Kentron sp. TUN]
MTVRTIIPKRRFRPWIAGALLLALQVLPVQRIFAVETIHIAVASNFVSTLRLLTASFEAESPRQVKISSASTGKLFAQVKHGAPFHLFLAADAQRPRRLVADGLAVPESLFTYAMGRLALWRPVGASDEEGPEILHEVIGRLAIANPKTAPYGKAARETLRALGLWKTWRSRLVRGENIGQTYQFVASGAAELGFVALSQIPLTDRIPTAPNHDPSKGQVWIVPSSLHTPLRQQAVLLNRESGNSGARAFMEFLKSRKAREVIEAQGYALSDP